MDRRRRGPHRSDEDEREAVIEMAHDLDEVLATEEEAMSEGEGSAEYAFRRHVNKIKAGISASMNERLDGLTGAFAAASSRMQTIAIALESHKKKVQLAARQRRSAETTRQQTWRRVKQSGILRYPWVVMISPITYRGVLVIASGAVGVLNASSFRVIRLSDPMALALAMFYAAVYALGIHLLPNAFGSNNNKRRVLLWGGLTIIGLILAGTVALTQIRGDYLTILEVTIDPWTFTVLHLVTDGIAAYAALIYGHEDAVALRQIEQKVKELTEQEAALKADLDLLDRNYWATRLERYGTVKGALREVENIRVAKAEELIGLLVVTLLKIRLVAPELLEDVDATVPEPAEVSEWKRWLVREAVHVGQAPPDEEPRRLPPAA